MIAGPTRRLNCFSKVSVIAPMRNEAEHVESFVADLVAQDLDRELEVLVADGISEDGSVASLQAAASRAGIDVTVIQNPARAVSQGLNACIRRATGDLVVRLDCHTRYPPDYLSRCVIGIEQTGAWNLGGVLVPTGRTRMERAVACAMDSPFGGIVWTRHGKSSHRTAVDTVPYGAFPREIFDTVGLFDESLLRNQDDEFNLRVRRAGGQILLDPSIRLHYIPRGSLRGVARQYFEYGLWKVPVMRKHHQVLGARSMVPMGFVASVAGLVTLSPLSRTARRLLAVELATYGAGALVFGARSVRRHREWSLLPVVITVFPAFHVGYGFGMIRGWTRALARR